MQKSPHIPVLLMEVIEYLDLKKGDIVVDGTFGFGGHSREILKKISSNGKLIGIEQDPEVFEEAQKTFTDKNLSLQTDNFKNLNEILEKLNIPGVDAILLDLGISSYHFDQSGRGFSFRRDEPLDMRLSGEGATAADLVNGLSKDELANLFFTLSDESMSRQIAKVIVEARKIEKINSTNRLVEIVESVKRWQGKIHPATKVFQALRIAVNNELNNLAEFLPQAIKFLKTGGRIVIISFHSGEDRIVKNIFKDFSRSETIEILTKKPVLPTFEEIRENPRSRSAKLRGAKKI